MEKAEIAQEDTGSETGSSTTVKGESTHDGSPATGPATP